ncbi:MAG: polysaccharide biosynthesis C-terminal domain-containing protein, partial [Bacteroidota bacterium]|nr:polysaccharide biosynthesis C-terminal domain-containing protein [Bacteroidota bacterium]
LRMDRRARRFASIRLTGIVVNIALNLVFVLALRMSIVAVFTANLLSSLVTTLLVIPSAVRDIRPHIEGTLARAMLAFGLPTVPAGIASMLMQVVDRPLMQRLAGDAAAGIYGANYRLGIFMMLVVTMFQYAWQPFALQSADLPEARRIFARVLTYFALVGSLVTVSVALFIDDVATVPLFHGHALIGNAYQEGLRIVPIILFAYLWTGFTAILNAGILIEKRTGYLALITVAGAAVNIAANLLLIPRLGYTGGALATFAAYLTTAVLAWFVGRKIFPVPWEYGRVGKILSAVGIIAALWYAGIGPAALPGPVWEAVLLAGFIALLFLFRVFLPSELRELRSLLRRAPL